MVSAGLRNEVCGSAQLSCRCGAYSCLDGNTDQGSTMTKAKLVLGVAVALAIALLAGWIWGASGRSAMARALETSELRNELLGARAAVLDARVAIYSVNFGEASGHLEGARGL